MDDTQTERPATTRSVFKTGSNCWRVAKADRFSLIVDASDYFKTLRQVVLQTKQELLLIGWDFDFELEMLPGESDADGNAPDGYPNQLGPFIEAAVKRAPDLQVYILKWNGAVLAAPGRLVPSVALYVFGDDRIHFALDGHHPFGACHHQKIVVADDTFAFCGGIDVTESRWDTSDHLPDDPRRVLKDGSAASPWHDATSALSGPVAAALAELSRLRWHRATGDKLEKPDATLSFDWPDGLQIDASDLSVAIARTEPPYAGMRLVNEIERLTLDSIAEAQNTIYIESQYLTTQTVCGALAKRLQEDRPPEIIVINPESALSGFEDKAMHVLRGRMIDKLKAADHRNRFRIFNPVTSAGEPIYVHAKVMIVDDRNLRIGSSNLDDRSMGFDTECDVAIEGPASLITAFRNRLLSEHLGATPAGFAEAVESEGSVIGAIDRLNAQTGRGLRSIKSLDEDMIGSVLADTRLLDRRYLPQDRAEAGKGLRPRHLAVLAGGIGLGVIAWKIWRRRT
ncbi:phospholipase D-like domain-containing protein [Loktanella sp. DJP18]|uniref:phospholipase D-like domain-containing protein n=1 Tax=Loktanella sp. DJP18 TaxID=3409788 RepID=UPI003BB6DC27